MGCSRTSQEAVLAEGLVRRFGPVTALAGVDLAVPRGSLFAVVGPNGAGKTTLLSILTTLLLPTAGKAEVLGFDVSRSPHEVRRRLGVAFQELSLDLDLPGHAVLDFHARLWGLGRSERRARVEQVARAVGLEQHLGRKVATYSGGMKRRLELARALLGRPQLLVLDEPTAQLDPHSREALWDVLGRLRREWELTVLFSTHYLEEAERVADQVAILDRGRVLAQGAPGALVRELGEEVLHVRAEGPLERVGPELQAAGARWWRCQDGVLEAGVASSGRALAAVVEAAGRLGVRLREVSVHRPSLHDLFLRLTGQPVQPGQPDQRAGDGG